MTHLLLAPPSPSLLLSFAVGWFVFQNECGISSYCIIGCFTAHCTALHCFVDFNVLLHIHTIQSPTNSHPIMSKQTYHLVKSLWDTMYTIQLVRCLLILTELIDFDKNYLFYVCHYSISYFHVWLGEAMRSIHCIDYPNVMIVIDFIEIANQSMFF